MRTIQASLAIEGNTLELEQVTAILKGIRVSGSKRELLEVQNAIQAYDLIDSFEPYSSKSLRQAHGILMSGLMSDAEKWRQANVGVFHEKIIWRFTRPFPRPQQAEIWHLVLKSAFLKNQAKRRWQNIDLSKIKTVSFTMLSLVKSNPY